jgi:hypothetical protein
MTEARTASRVNKGDSPPAPRGTVSRYALLSGQAVNLSIHTALQDASIS